MTGPDENAARPPRFGEDAAPNRLEVRYRSALRLLPAGYREVWEEEMVATFLDSVETDDPDEAEYAADYGRPSWSELASVAALAVRLRIGNSGGPARYLAWGAALRLAALSLLLVNAVTGTVEVINRLWLAGVISWLPAPAGEWRIPLPTESWRLAWELAGALWPAAFLALVLGHRRPARVFVALAILPSAVAAVTYTVQWGPGPFLLLPWFFVLLDAGLLLALTAFHRDAAPVRAWPWLLALPAGVSAVYALLFATLPTDAATMPVLDLPGLCCLALLVAGLALLTAQRFGSAGRSAAWPHALALLSLAAFGVRVVTLVSYASATTVAGSDFQDSTWLTLGIAEAAAVLALGAALSFQVTRALRRLPPPAADAPAWSAPPQ